MGLCLPACLACQKLPYAPKTLQTHSNVSKTFQDSPRRFKTSSCASKHSQIVPNNAQTFPKHSQHPTTPEPSKRSQNPTCFQNANALPSALRRSQNAPTDEKTIVHGCQNHMRAWDRKSSTAESKGKSAQHTQICDSTIPKLCNRDLQVELRCCPSR